MVRTEPADWVLLPPPNRARPLQALTVDELAELHREHADTPAVVALLRTELTSRPFSKTEQLRAAVARETVAQPEPEATPRPDAAPAPGILCCSRCQKRLRIPHLPEPSEIRCPSCRTEYTVHWQGLVCLVQVLADTAAGEDENGEDRTDAVDEPATEPADAWAVLGLAPNSPWEQVERARRSLLQQYHPDRLGHVSPLVRQLAETAFKRVSDAYETLKAQR
ncbi:MAG: J domain-containing protein, partial [Hydrogenophaga sp.]|nr:J domain-containing protein [Hydrogenophaga sp.]